MAAKEKGDTSKTGSRDDRTEDKLISNTIELQKLNISLLEKLDKLNDQISSLLYLFDTAAKSLVEGSGNPVSTKDREFLDKMDSLFEQNKTIAKGLTMIDDKVRGKTNTNNPETKEASDEPNKDAGKFPEQQFKPELKTKPLLKF